MRNRKWFNTVDFLIYIWSSFWRRVEKIGKKQIEIFNDDLISLFTGSGVGSPSGSLQACPSPPLQAPSGSYVQGIQKQPGQIQHTDPQ